MTNRQHHFWGSLSPLGGLAGAGILIMTSARLSWAIITAGSLLWVYSLAVLAYTLLSTSSCRKIFPKEGKYNVFTCLSCFFGSLYLFLIWLLCPLAAFEIFLPLMLVPLFCDACFRSGSPGLLHLIDSHADSSHIDVFYSVSEAVSQAATLSVLLVIFSFIREPLAYCSLSLPGSYNGMICLTLYKEGEFFPAGIFASSAGALLLLGYFICIFQYSRSVLSPGDVEK